MFARSRRIAVAAAIVAAAVMPFSGSAVRHSAAQTTVEEMPAPTATPAAAAASATAPAPAPLWPTIGRTTSQVRLRAEPDQDGAILVLIPDDAPIVVLGRAEEGYFPAAWNRLSGWVATGSIETPAQPAARSAADISELLAKQEALADGQLNVRAEPAADADVVATMTRHQPAQLTGRVAGGYVEVEEDGETGWIEGRFLSAPGAGGAPREYRREEIIQIIYEAADYYHQSREDMLQVARCESDLTPTATDEIGGAYGLFQFKPFTWDDTPYAAYDIFDPRANAFAAAWMWSVGNKDAWVCQ